MVEYDRTQDREHVASAPVKICVVGIGGAGLNVLDRIALDRIVDAPLIGMHTDVRVLSHTMTQHKLQLGTDIMRGIGSGGDPELGRSAAEDSSESIRSLLQGHDMVFICAGLGGGTGSGAVPVVAQIAKECGALVFIFATTPFSFEGRRRLVQAEMALEQLQTSADALILFENNRMGELVLPREGIQKAFSQADQIIGHSVRAITSMVMQPGLVRLGLSDLMTALRSPNARCLFGFGEARGTNRVAEAIKKALKSPLIHQGQLLQQSQNLIVHVAGGDTLTLAEVEGLMKQLGKHIPDQTQILFGISVDAKLGDSLALTLLSSLSAQQMACEIRPAVAAPQEEHTPITRARIVAATAKQPEDVEPAPVALGSNGGPATVRHEEPSPIVVEELPKREPMPVAARQKSEPAPIAARSNPEPAPAAPPAIEDETPLMPAILEMAPPLAKAPLPPVAEPKKEEAPALIKTSIFSVIDDETEAVDEEEDEEENEEEEDGVEAALPPAAIVVPKPSARPRVHPKSNYASPSAFEPEDEPKASHGAAAESTAPKPEPALASAGRPSPMLQPTLNLHQEEIARFKGTDKTIVEGEDLDVPTWMRMRQKNRR
jgi:cell division protein FtsZ